MSDNAKQIVIGIIIGLIVGLLSGIVATYFKMNERITSLEIKLENYHALSNTEGIQETQPESAKRASAEPEELIEIVKTMSNIFITRLENSARIFAILAFNIVLQIYLLTIKAIK